MVDKKTVDEVINELEEISNPKDLNEVIEFFEWLENKEYEDFNDKEKKNIKRNVHRNTDKKAPERKGYKTDSEFDEAKKKWEDDNGFFKDNPEIKNYFVKKNEVAKNCFSQFENFRKQIIKQLKKKEINLVPAKSNQTNFQNSGTIYPYFSCKLTKPEYTSFPINIAFGVNSDGVFACLDIVKDTSTRKERKAFNKHFKKKFCQSDSLIYSCEIIENNNESKGFKEKFDEQIGDLNSLANNTTVPDGVKIGLEYKIGHQDENRSGFLFTKFYNFLLIFG